MRRFILASLVSWQVCYMLASQLWDQVLNTASSEVTRNHSALITVSSDKPWEHCQALSRPSQSGSWLCVLQLCYLWPSVKKALWAKGLRPATRIYPSKQIHIFSQQDTDMPRSSSLDFGRLSVHQSDAALSSIQGLKTNCQQLTAQSIICIKLTLTQM